MSPLPARIEPSTSNYLCVANSMLEPCESALFDSMLSSSGAWQGPFGYAGAFGYQEDATGLMLLGHRLYDPSTGRFLTRDPIKDGRNWFVYSESDPVNGVDPDGLDRKVLDAIRKGIAKGQLPRGTDIRYKNDKRFEDQIHRAIGDEKRGRGDDDRRNPDLPEKELLDLIRGLLFYRPPAPSPYLRIDWDSVGKGELVGLAVVAGIAIIAGSGGTATPAVAKGAAVIGGLLLAPKPRFREGGA